MFLSRRTLAPLSRRAVWAGVFFAAAFLLFQSGCVQRRMTIRSNPPGALVYVDDYEIGTTPVSTNFLYYGNRKIRLVKDGYETLTVLQPVPIPWYQYTPFDFIAENFVPGEIRDQRTFDFQLKPQMVVPTDQLLSRAESMRQNSYAPSLGTSAAQPGAYGPGPIPGNPGSLPNAAPYVQPNVNQPLNTYPPPNTFPQPNTYPPPNTYPLNQQPTFGPM
ncbi:MAG TPA: PEGA domain-containing protein [Thermoguttaceae bacterium]